RRRLIDQLQQARAITLGARRAELRSQLVIVSRSFGDGPLFRFTYWLDAVVPAGDRHTSRVVFHRSQQSRQQHRRVWRPVSVMAAVQRPLRAVTRDVNVLIAANAADHLLASRL